MQIVSVEVEVEGAFFAGIAEVEKTVASMWLFVMTLKWWCSTWDRNMSTLAAKSEDYNIAPHHIQ